MKLLRSGSDMMENAVMLQPMRPLQEALDEDDNWTGLGDAKARRRRQNRLNQRASRRRKEQMLASKFQALPPAKDGSVIPYGTPMMTIRPPTESSPHPFSFPLSVDYLLTLVQFNVYRAVYTNMVLIGSPATSVTSCEMPELMITPLPLPNTAPPALLPTPLQSSVLHLVWIDLFPLPALRDNLIRQWGTYDACELCDDVVGALWDDQPTQHDERLGFICWGDPWDVNSWEVMEGFVKKWEWLLDGCEELFVATNRWRTERGEEPIQYGRITELS